MANTLITWEQGSPNPDNAQNFATISQWWAGMQGKEIAWKQRVLTGLAQELDWEPARFDEKFTLYTSQIRGITLYWRRENKPEAIEKNSTAAKLELDTQQQQLYIYPQSQKELVIRIGIPEIIYQEYTINNPQIALGGGGDQYTLLLRDAKQQMEIKVILDRANLQLLQTKLAQSTGTEDANN